MVTLNPALVRAAVPAAAVWPCTSGTVTIGGPVDTYTTTVWSLRTLVPPTGSVLITLPDGTRSSAIWE